MAGNDRMIFKENRYSFRALSAMVLGCLSALLFVAMAAVSAALGGKTGMWAGALGTSALAAAAAGVILGLGSFRDRQRSFALCKAGTIISGIMTAAWFLVFCAGVM